jgi:hypothetical protein
MNKFVDQHNPCVLVIMPSFVPLAFSQNKVSWHLLFLFKKFYGLKIGAKTHFKTRFFTKLVFIKLQGYSVVIPLFHKTTTL